jgi:hypothetical protein
MDIRTTSDARWIRAQYGICQHLQNCCKARPEFLPLLHVFALDSKNFANITDATAMHFPHYSLHDSTHAASVLSNIEQFLGEDRIQMLSPTDCWLLLMAVYMHDIGMAAAQQSIDALDDDEEFLQYCIRMKNGTQEELRTAANYIVNEVNERRDYQDMCEYARNNHNAQGAIRNIYDAFWYIRMLVADYMRREHPSAAYKIVSQNISEFHHRGIISERLVHLYAKIAMMHGMDYNQILSKLELETNGFRNDTAHPRFIAAMLRLGDIFDLDNNRFNEYYFHVIGKIPRRSSYNYMMHKSIDHLRITPTELEISADIGMLEDVRSVNIVGVYKVIFDWFACIRNEVDALAKYWFSLVPDDTVGKAPVLIKQRIHYHGQEVETSQQKMYMEYRMDYLRAFDFIQGPNLYTGELPFLREMVQNSFDALKKRIYRKLQPLAEKKALKAMNGVAQLNALQWLSLFLWEYRKYGQEYTPQITIELINTQIVHENENSTTQKTVRFTVADNGIGFTPETVQRLQKVGDSLSSNVYRENMGIPGFMKPTGEFGIGLHSIYAVSEHMRIVSKSMDTGETHNILGEGPKAGSHVIDFPQWVVLDSEFQEIARNDYGTTVSVDVPWDKVVNYLSWIPSYTPQDEVELCEMLVDKLKFMFSPNIFPLNVIVKRVSQKKDYCAKHEACCKSETPQSITPYPLPPIPSIFDSLLLERPIQYDKSSESAYESILSNLESLCDDDCLVWVTSEPSNPAIFHILCLNMNNPTSRANKNLYMSVSFCGLHRGQENTTVSFKGSWLRSAEPQLKFQDLNIQLIILGRRARHIITISRDYLLPDKTHEMLLECRYMIDALIRYLSRCTTEKIDRWLASFTPESITTLMLYLHSYIWNHSDKDYSSIVQLLSHLRTFPTASIRGHVYENGVLQDSLLDGNRFLSNPLEYLYVAKELENSYINLRAPSNSDVLRKKWILHDLISRISPKLSLSAIYILQREDAKIIECLSFSDKPHQDVFINPAERLAYLEYLHQEYLSHQKDLFEKIPSMFYIPCLQPYTSLGVERADQHAQERWPLCQKFILFPYCNWDPLFIKSQTHSNITTLLNKLSEEIGDMEMSEGIAIIDDFHRFEWLELKKFIDLYARKIQELRAEKTPIHTIKESALRLLLDLERSSQNKAYNSHVYEE